MPDDIEDILAPFIRVHFVEQGRSLARAHLQPLIRVPVHDLIAEGAQDRSFPNFKSFRRFLTRFPSRAGVSFRRARAERRLASDDDEGTHFLARVIAAYHRYPPHLIRNLDESNWHLVMASDQIVAERGAEIVHQYIAGDRKANFPFFAMITAEGDNDCDGPDWSLP